MQSLKFFTFSFPDAQSSKYCSLSSRPLMLTS
jgi:hypothetical protein